MTPTTGLSSVANTHKECPHQVESGDFIELELDFDFEFESSERARARARLDIDTEAERDRPGQAGLVLLLCPDSSPLQLWPNRGRDREGRVSTTQSSSQKHQMITMAGRSRTASPPFLMTRQRQIFTMMCGEPLEVLAKVGVG